MSPPHVSLVTGSARGLGRAVAEALLERADQVHVVWRSSEASRAELEQAFPGRVHRADLVQPAQVEALVAAVLARDGRLDTVVHAVGEYTSGSLESLGAARLERLFASNVHSAALLLGAVRSALRGSRGCFVGFGCAGLESLRARRETAGYTAAKTALLVLLRSAALEEAAHGVRVNLVSPGIVPHDGADPDTLDPERIARIPLGRAGRPQDVAAAVRWLSGEEASHVTGQNLEVAGGWML